MQNVGYVLLGAAIAVILVIAYKTQCASLLGTATVCTFF